MVQAYFGIQSIDYDNKCHSYSMTHHNMLRIINKHEIIRRKLLVLYNMIDFVMCEVKKWRHANALSLAHKIKYRIPRKAPF